MPGLRDGTPAEAGLDEDRLGVLDERCRELVERGQCSTVIVSLARNGVVAHQAAFGAGSVDSLVQAASITKPVTAAVIMSLVDDGLVGLTRPVAAYIPDFRGKGKARIAVHHALTHTSGLHGPDYFVDFEEFESSIGRADDRDAWISVLSARDFDSEPGELMVYASLNYILLGEVIRGITGRPIGEVYRERVFDRAGMGDASLGVAAAERARLVMPPWMTRQQSDEEQGAVGAGGLVATARDLTALAQVFLDGGVGANGRIVSPVSSHLMTTDQIPGVQAWYPPTRERVENAAWGYGWQVSSSERWAYSPVLPPGSFGHDGATGCFTWGDPSLGLAGTVVAHSAVSPIEIRPKIAAREIDAWDAVSPHDLLVNAARAAVTD